MLIGILQFELLIHGAASLKDKRRVVSSLKDRLHREHQAAVAEVGLLDNMHAARMGLAVVGSDGKHLAQCLDRITAKLRAIGPDAELGDCFREIIANGDAADVSDQLQPPASGKDFPDEALAAELLARVGDAAAEIDKMTISLTPNGERSANP